MRFYSGFCLQNESGFFATYLKESAYTVSGFSYGAVKAFRDVMNNKKSRVDTLQLFSPAYFGNKPDRFVRLQLQGYARDARTYRARFIESCFAPYPAESVEVTEDDYSALEDLLTFQWPVEQLQELVSRGVAIEVYLGEKDAVIDADAARKHFAPYATTFYIKNVNHFLQGDPI